MLRGFLIAAIQTYAGICILLAKNRPKPLMMQAGVLGRAIFENFATVLALTERPETRASTLMRESIRMFAERYQRDVKRYGKDPKWKEFLEVFLKGQRVILKEHKIPLDVINDPSLIKDEWPTPGAMLWGNKRKNLKPFVSGSRHAVLKELYENHYAFQSAQAHGRIAAVGMALLVDQPEDQWNPGHGESNVLTTAMLCLACILSEIEVAGGYAHHPKLSESWLYLRQLDDEAKTLWVLRYEALLKS